jgi:hypothetical protein
MKFPKIGSAPFGFGGPGAPPGFGSSAGSSSGGNPIAPPRRRGNRDFGKVNRDPGNDPRIRSFVDLLQEMFNSLGERGFISRDAQLRWSLASSLWREARDPTATDDSTVGVLAGEFWVNTETGSVWFAVSVAAGAAVWLEMLSSSSPSSFLLTMPAEFAVDNPTTSPVVTWVYGSLAGTLDHLGGITGNF